MSGSARQFILLLLLAAIAGRSIAYPCAEKPCEEVGKAFAKYAQSFIALEEVQGVREYLINKTGLDVSDEENAESYVCRITVAKSLSEMVRLMDLSSIDERLFLDLFKQIKEMTSNGQYHELFRTRQEAILSAERFLSETNFPDFPTGYTLSAARDLFDEYSNEALSQVFCAFYHAGKDSIMKAFAEAQTLDDFLRQSNTGFCLHSYLSSDYQKKFRLQRQVLSANDEFIQALDRSGFLNLPLTE